MSYDARVIKRDEDTDDVLAFGLTWDGEELLSVGPVFELSCHENISTLLCVVEDPVLAYMSPQLAIAQFFANDLDTDPEAALMLGLDAVDRLIKYLPGLRAAMAARE